MISTTGTLSVIMKTTENCNLNCSYCYEGDKKKADMSLDIAVRAIERIAKEAEERARERRGKPGSEVIPSAQLIWHGGEPLLRGVDFYKKMVEAQRGFGEFKFYNELQTNLTLLNEPFIDFFIENGFRIGGSLDGPKEINDLSRPTSTGGSSFDKAIKNLFLARERGLKIGVITVIGKHNYKNIKEVYNFFRDNNIDFEPNQLTIDGNALINKEKFGLSPEEFGKSAIELFDLWFYDKSENLPTASSFMKNAIELLTGNPIECTHTGRCRDKYLSIATNGDVYPCGRFGEHTPEFKLGNILESPLRGMVLSEKQKEIALRDTGEISECVECEYVPICRGGCPYNAYSAFGTVREKDYFCEGYKLIFRHISKVLGQEIGKLADQPTFL